MRVLTLDLGLGSLKACLWQDNTLKARYTASLSTHARGDCAEQDARVWWDSVVLLVRRLVSEHSSASEIDVIGVTGHMHALVPVDARGEPLGPVATVSDRRARGACHELAAALGTGQILRWTGGLLDPTCALAKARHFHQESDPAWQAARWILPPKDYLRMRLTGEAITDPIDAAGTMLWDVERAAWRGELCAFVGLPLEKLPAVCPTISLGGRLTREAAETLGLQAGVPVAVGGGDDIEAFGAGALKPGDIYEHLGTTGSIYAAAARPLFDPDCRVETYPDVLPGRWLVGGSTSAAGLAFRWAHTLTGRRENWEDTNGLFERIAANRLPSDVLFLPYLAGERAPVWDAERSGAFLGLRAEHGPEEMLQATLEGVSYSLRAVMDALQAAGGLQPGGRVYASGPLGASADFGQIRADIYGRSVAHYDLCDDTTSVAAMVLAVCAMTGEAPYALMAQRLALDWTAQVRPEVRPAYERAYQRYRQVSNALADFDHQNAACNVGATGRDEAPV